MGVGLAGIPDESRAGGNDWAKDHLLTGMIHIHALLFHLLSLPLAPDGVPGCRRWWGRHERQTRRGLGVPLYLPNNTLVARPVLSLTMSLGVGIYIRRRPLVDEK